MKKPSAREPATTEQVVGVVIALIVILVPIISVVAFPSNHVIQLLFGDTRILAWWVIIAVVVFAYKEKIDRFVANKVRKQRNRRK